MSHWCTRIQGLTFRRKNKYSDGVHAQWECQLCARRSQLNRVFVSDEETWEARPLTAHVTPKIYLTSLESRHNANVLHKRITRCAMGSNKLASMKTWRSLQTAHFRWYKRLLLRDLTTVHSRMKTCASYDENLQLVIESFSLHSCEETEWSEMMSNLWCVSKDLRSHRRAQNREISCQISTSFTTNQHSVLIHSDPSFYSLPWILSIVSATGEYRVQKYSTLTNVQRDFHMRSISSEKTRNQSYTLYNDCSRFVRYCTLLPVQRAETHKNCDANDYAVVSDSAGLPRVRRQNTLDVLGRELASTVTNRMMRRHTFMTCCNCMPFIASEIIV